MTLPPRHLVVLALPVLGACGGSEPPPDDLSEPTLWLLTHFDDAEGSLDPHVSALADFAASLSATAPLSDRRYAPELPDEHQEVSLEGPPPVGPLLSGAVVGRSMHDVDDHRRFLDAPDLSCGGGPLVQTWSREVVPEGCFGIGACDEARATDGIEEEGPGGPLSFGMITDLRELALEDDRDALLARRILVEPVGDDATRRLHRRYELSLWVTDQENARETWRVDALWWDGSASGDTERIDALVADRDAGYRRRDAALDQGDSCAAD